jgi:hypothetical protein
VFFENHPARLQQVDGYSQIRSRPNEQMLALEATKLRA